MLNRLLIQYHPFPFWPIFPLLRPQDLNSRAILMNLPYTDFWLPKFKISCPFSVSKSLPRMSRCLRSCVSFRNILVSNPSLPTPTPRPCSIPKLEDQSLSRMYRHTLLHVSRLWAPMNARFPTVIALKVDLHSWSYVMHVMRNQCFNFLHAVHLFCWCEAAQQVSCSTGVVLFLLVRLPHYVCVKTCLALWVV
jgi:hypothetical protein